MMTYTERLERQESKRAQAVAEMMATTSKSPEWYSAKYMLDDCDREIRHLEKEITRELVKLVLDPAVKTLKF